MTNPDTAGAPEMATEQLTLTQPTPDTTTAAHGLQETPQEASLPHSCRCQARWGGQKTAHCPTCHLTFTVASNFDRHRRGGARRRPYAALPITDDGDAVALIRYDGDPDVYTAIAWTHALTRGHAFDDITINPPEPGLYRISPCSPRSCGDHSWHYDHASRRGPGVFTAAPLVLNHIEATR